MYRPSSVLIIALCVLTLGMSFVTLWFIDSRLPYSNIAASLIDTNPVILPTTQPTPQEVDRCEPVVDETQREKQVVVIATLEAEITRLKLAHMESESAWQAKAEQHGQDLAALQHAAEGAIAISAKDWQAGKLMLAHALLKKTP